MFGLVLLYILVGLAFALTATYTPVRTLNIITVLLVTLLWPFYSKHV